MKVDRMTSQPEVTIIVTSYNRRSSLERCLLSLARQAGLPAAAYEVVVADDGSSDGSNEMVRSLSMDLPYRLRVVTQVHNGYQKARIMNRALLMSEGQYLLLTDADCIFRADYVRTQLADRQSGTAWAGDCIRLSKDDSERITKDSIISGYFMSLVPTRLPQELRTRHHKNLFYALIKHPSKPKLVGWNVAVWAKDLFAINGFDENFVGWGCEDDDLAMRLRQSGVRIKSNASRNYGYHLWHEVDPTAPVNWCDGANVPYLLRPMVFQRCLNGIEKRGIDDLSICISADRAKVTSSELRIVDEIARRLGQVPGDLGSSNVSEAELEVRFGDSRVSASWSSVNRIQVLLDGQSVRPTRVRPHLVIDTANCSATSETPKLRVFNPNAGDDCIGSENESAITQPQPWQIADWLIEEIENAINGDRLAAKDLLQPENGGDAERNQIPIGHRRQAA